MHGYVAPFAHRLRQPTPQRPRFAETGPGDPDSGRIHPPDPFEDIEPVRDDERDPVALPVTRPRSTET